MLLQSSITSFGWWKPLKTAAFHAEVKAMDCEFWPPGAIISDTRRLNGNNYHETDIDGQLERVYITLHTPNANSRLENGTEWSAICNAIVHESMHPMAGTSILIGYIMHVYDHFCILHEGILVEATWKHRTLMAAGHYNMHSGVTISFIMQ